MDPISTLPIAIGVWEVIAPYLGKLAGKLADRAVEALPEAVGKVWDTVKDKMESKPETSTLPGDLCQAPEDKDLQGAFKYQLKKLVENDEKFAAQLETLVREASRLPKFSAQVQGDGAIAQGEAAKAVGKNGILIEGDVSGTNIIVGDHGKITSKTGRPGHKPQRNNR